MNDLASHIFNTANAMNRAKAAELSESPKGRWDTPFDISPAVVKIPLRAEVRDMLKAADLYDEQADRQRNMAEACAVNAKGYNEEADRLESLACKAREQAENLQRQADL